MAPGAPLNRAVAAAKATRAPEMADRNRILMTTPPLQPTAATWIVALGNKLSQWPDPTLPWTAGRGGPSPANRFDSGSLPPPRRLPRADLSVLSPPSPRGLPRLPTDLRRMPEAAARLSTMRPAPDRGELH